MFIIKNIDTYLFILSFICTLNDVIILKLTKLSRNTCHFLSSPSTFKIICDHMLKKNHFPIIAAVWQHQTEQWFLFCGNTNKIVCSIDEYSKLTILIKLKSKLKINYFKLTFSNNSIVTEAFSCKIIKFNLGFLKIYWIVKIWSHLIFFQCIHTCILNFNSS